MENWADKTFWVQQTPAFAFVVNPEEEIDMTDFLGEEVVSVGSHPSCHACPHVHPCMNSLWLDGTRAGGPTLKDTTETYVSFCPVCLTTSLSPPGGSLPGVPTLCPRKQKAGVFCSSCQDLSVRLRDQNESLRSLRGIIQDSLQELRQGTLDGKKMMDRMIAPVPRVFENQKLASRSQYLMAALIQDLGSRFPLVAAPDEEGPELRYHLYLAMTMGKPEDVAKAFLMYIMFFSWDQWETLSLPQRKMALTVWMGFARWFMR